MRLAWLAYGILLLSVPQGAAIAVAQSPTAASHHLDVRTEPGGGIRATAIVDFPVDPAIIQRILTDFPHWPDLFDVRMRMADVREQNGRTLTDIRISHALLPGERRLLCESRMLPEGGLITELKGGDFKQYRRVWKLHPVEGGNRTRAEFDLLVELDTIMPDWILSIAMRRDLEVHFGIVTDKALAMSTAGR